jgi:hypothetical protein
MLKSPKEKEICRPRVMTSIIISCIHNLQTTRDREKDVNDATHQKLITTAITMLKQNIPYPLIMQVTGLSKDELDKLKCQL